MIQFITESAPGFALLGLYLPAEFFKTNYTASVWCVLMAASIIPPLPCPQGKLHTRASPCHSWEDEELALLVILKNTSMQWEQGRWITTLYVCLYPSGRRTLPNHHPLCGNGSKDRVSGSCFPPTPVKGLGRRHYQRPLSVRG